MSKNEAKKEIITWTAVHRHCKTIRLTSGQAWVKLRPQEWEMVIGAGQEWVKLRPQEWEMVIGPGQEWVKLRPQAWEMVIGAGRRARVSKTPASGVGNVYWRRARVHKTPASGVGNGYWKPPEMDSWSQREFVFTTREWGWEEGGRGREPEANMEVKHFFFNLLHTLIQSKKQFIKNIKLFFTKILLEKVPFWKEVLFMNIK